LENSINELKTTEARNKFNHAKEESKAAAVDKEMEIKLWNLNNTVQELEQKRMQMELEKNLLFKENLRLTEKLKNVSSTSQKFLVGTTITKDECHNKESSLDNSSVGSEIPSKEDRMDLDYNHDKYDQMKKELNEKSDQLNHYKRLIEKKTKEIHSLNKKITNLEEENAELNSEKVKLENNFDIKLEKIRNQYQAEITTYKNTLKYKTELHQKEKVMEEKKK